MLSRTVKLFVTVILLWLLVQQLDWVKVLAVLSGLSLWTVLLSVVLQVLVLVLGVWRWQMFFKHENLPHTFSWLSRPFFIGALFNNVLPAATGGDLLRIYYIYREGYGTVIAASPVITERMIGFTVLFGIATSVLPFTSFTAEWFAGLSRLLPPIFFGLTLFLALLGWPRSYRPLHNLLESRAKIRIIKALLKIAESSHGYLGEILLVFRIVILSIAMQVTEIVVFWVLAIGVGSEIPFTMFLLSVPLTMALAGLPISIGGFGVREATAVVLFTASGMATSHAAAVTFLFIPVLLISSLPGLYYFLTTRDSKSLLQGVQLEDLHR
jgi:uncharacterized protein (TIRG00374 family)